MLRYQKPGGVIVKVALALFAIAYLGVNYSFLIWLRFIDESNQRLGMAAVVSVISKELLYWYTRYWGEKLSSSALVAKAWDHRSDAFASIGTTLGIGGAILLGE